MFSELSKIFGKDFTIGYMLPAVLFVLACWGALFHFDLRIPMLEALIKELTTSTIFLVLTSWLLGIVLVALNNSIYKIFEGYGRFNPAQFFSFLERRRYKRLNESIASLETEWKCKGNAFPLTKIKEVGELMEERAKTFPDDELWLLPTGLGNRIRAFEVYPRVLYGFESITGWPRLLAVVPQEYREAIDSIKAQSDFWLNISFLSVLYFIIHLTITIYFGLNIFYEWLLLAPIGVAIVSYVKAKDRVVEWGEFVKSAFDVFLPALRKKMGFQIPTNIRNEKELWSAYSRAMQFRDPEEMPPRNNPSE